MKREHKCIRHTEEGIEVMSASNIYFVLGSIFFILGFSGGVPVLINAFEKKSHFIVIVFISLTLIRCFLLSKTFYFAFIRRKLFVIYGIDKGEDSYDIFSKDKYIQVRDKRDKLFFVKKEDCLHYKDYKFLNERKIK